MPKRHSFLQTLHMTETLLPWTLQGGQISVFGGVLGLNFQTRWGLWRIQVHQSNSINVILGWHKARLILKYLNLQLGYINQCHPSFLEQQLEILRVSCPSFRVLADCEAWSDIWNDVALSDVYIYINLDTWIHQRIDMMQLMGFTEKNMVYWMADDSSWFTTN